MNNQNLPIYLTSGIIIAIVVFVAVFAMKKNNQVVSSNNTPTEIALEEEPVKGRPINLGEAPSDSTSLEASQPIATDQSETSSQQVSTGSDTQTVSTQQCVNKFTPASLNSVQVNPEKDRKVQLSIKDFGDIEVELYPEDAPKASANFLKLAASGFYDCLTFHRVSKNFVIQGGDPNGNGSGGYSIYNGKPFADELDQNTPSFKTGYKKGVLAMANSGPNTNSSQFFIMLADNDTLPKAYTIFGKVTKGISVVDKIGKVEITPSSFGPTDGAPKVPVVITKASVVK